MLQKHDVWSENCNSWHILLDCAVIRQYSTLLTLLLVRRHHSTSSWIIFLWWYICHSLHRLSIVAVAHAAVDIKPMMPLKLLISKIVLRSLSYLVFCFFFQHVMQQYRRSKRSSETSLPWRWRIRNMRLMSLARYVIVW